MATRTIALFTKDMPALEGPGKSIRLMHWLADLSVHYDLIYCIYLGAQLTVPANLGNKIQFIPILLIKPNAIHSIWRRLISGLVWPNLYSVYWYERISDEGFLKIAELIDRSEDILFFRLYLFPVLFAFKKKLIHKSVRMDLDDVDGLTMQQIARAQWDQGYYIKWLETRIGMFYFKYYEHNVHEMVEQFYYANPNDKEYLTHKYPDAKIHCFPNKVLYQEAPIHRPRPEATLLFAGALNYFPNIDAIRFFLNDIWPEVLKQQPDATLIVAGSQPDRHLKVLIQSTSGCILIENPESMKKIFNRATLMVVPLRLGGGTRIKILQAFSYGLPVLSTAIGSSGIAGAESKSLIIADDKNDLVDACMKILRNPALGTDMAKKAYAVFMQFHSFSWS